MHGHDEKTRHTELVDRMAQALGVDLQALAAEGQLDRDELDRVVVRCTACSDPDDCETWLDHQPDGLDTPPYYCCNQALFERLMAVRAT
ncbi:DUF6455 family protein [Thalassovita sp.]|uniref:DUF6455 family protein n=1 Tax=Thalassovita sp. TaxID=1979401 RepID=UPI0029DE7D21|nr:DUF6455 family protein [Thalassovita sp.]